MRSLADTPAHTHKDKEVEEGEGKKERERKKNTHPYRYKNTYFPSRKSYSLLTSRRFLNPH